MLELGEEEEEGKEEEEKKEDQAPPSQIKTQGLQQRGKPRQRREAVGSSYGRADTSTYAPMPSEPRSHQVARRDILPLTAFLLSATFTHV